MKRLSQLLAALVFMTGCASVQSVSVTSIPSHRSKQIHAEVSKMVFLGLSFDNDFVDPLVEDLKRQCPNGVVTGILTKQEVINYFLVFNHRVTSTGYCNVTVAKQGGGRRGTASLNDEPSIELPDVEAEN